MLFNKISLCSKTGFVGPRSIVFNIKGNYQPQFINTLSDGRKHIFEKMILQRMSNFPLYVFIIFFFSVITKYIHQLITKLLKIQVIKQDNIGHKIYIRHIPFNVNPLTNNKAIKNTSNKTRQNRTQNLHKAYTA